MIAPTKHIIIIVLMLFASIHLVKAQSSSLEPFEGATHNYRWDGLQQGVNYEFYITANADGSGLYDDGLTGEFDILSATGTVGSDGYASTLISWYSGASSNIYYVWLQVTNADGCSNYRYVPVTPQVNDFDLLSENIPVTNTISCPDKEGTQGFDPDADTYSAGTTDLQFKIKRENGDQNWSFIPALNVAPDLSLTNVIITVEGTNSGVLTADVDGRYTVLDTDSEVTVTVSIENAPGYDRAVTLQVTNQREENTNLSDSDSSNDNVTHTIQVMPLINSMGGV